MNLNKDILRWSLEELASEKEQNRLWLGLSKDEMSSFEEARCGVFDDSGLARLMDQGLIATEYGTQVSAMVSHLNLLLRDMPIDAFPEEILSHHLMPEIRKTCSWLLESTLLNRNATGSEGDRQYGNP